MAGFVWYFFSTGGAIALLSACAVWALVSPRSTAARRSVVGVALFYWLAATAIVPDTLRDVMAAGYTPLTRAAVPAGRTAVVLLGSGSVRIRDWSDAEIPLVDTIGASRLVEAARVFRLLGAEYVISSGGLPTNSDRTRPSGQTMAEELVALGIPEPRVLVETRSRTTHDEAVIVRDMLQARPVDQVVLVTSQFHMRRSVGTFKAVGIDVVPAIAREPQAFDLWWERLIPTDKGLKDTAMAAHELAGLGAYAARGWYVR